MPDPSAQRLARLLTTHLGGEGLARPAYRSLAAAIRALAVDGRLAQDSRLPSERELAAALGLSRTTTTRAYASLVAEGWATSAQGSGTFLHIPGGATHARAPLVPLEGVEIDLTAAAGTCVPGTNALITEALGDLPAVLQGRGYEPIGYPPLREAIAAHYAARGLPTSPDQIVVTSGAMAAIAVVLRATLRRGDRAAVEATTHPTSLGALRGAGARLVALPAGEERVWDPAAAAAVMRGAEPRLTYLIPDFHNPTGALMPEDDRARLGRLSAAHGGVVLADEALVDLRLDPVAMPLPFAAHHPEAFSVGSVSKPLWGGVRVGWVRAPRSGVSAVRAARLTLDLGASALDQLVAARFLRDPGVVLAGRLAELRGMREAWLGAMAAHETLSGWRVASPPGGLALWVGLGERVAPEMAAAARRRGVAVAVGPQFSAEGGARDRIRLPLTARVDVPTLAGVLAESYAEALTGADARAGASVKPTPAPVV
ncbi:PLP-dependent aminotransferase family protein [Serinibacter salmoneus]|uniref:GntR family transcriptional regulator n=1 Tax=Serinibacter salmoneus TaxID=556530 RepID=A0A2A9CWB0_9MICO|nr:PLP-dependent aminotransferase family protein [Serinibacter salmoneus]PFG18714.1 GntR family transcriptional regulator [Serinibacter salmoneus]